MATGPFYRLSRDRRRRLSLQHNLSPRTSRRRRQCCARMGARSVWRERRAPAPEAAGNIISWYLEFVDNRNLELGTRDFNGSPRFSTGYVPLRNRPGILIETHMIKDYGSRVIGTYHSLRAALTEVNRDPQRLRQIGREADQRIVEAG